MERVVLGIAGVVFFLIMTAKIAKGIERDTKIWEEQQKKELEDKWKEGHRKG